MKFSRDYCMMLFEERYKYQHGDVHVNTSVQEACGYWTVSITVDTRERKTFPNDVNYRLTLASGSSVCKTCEEACIDAYSQVLLSAPQNILEWKQRKYRYERS